MRARLRCNISLRWKRSLVFFCISLERVSILVDVENFWKARKCIDWPLMTEDEKREDRLRSMRRKKKEEV